MTKRTSLRAAARARYRDAAEQASPTRTASPSDLPLSGGGREARAVDTPLTAQARALYEDSVVPVREIARRAGVCERTLYKYVQKGGWRRRHRVRGEAAAAANRGRRLAPAEHYAAVKGAGSPFVARSAGGRFVRREEAGLPHARGLKALDPEGAAAAAAACIEARAMSEAAVAQASADAAARAARAMAETQRRVALRSFERLCRALTDLVAQRRERPAGAIPRADRLDARLQRVILGEMGRLIGRR